MVCMHVTDAVTATERCQTLITHNALPISRDKTRYDNVQNNIMKGSNFDSLRTYGDNPHFTLMGGMSIALGKPFEKNIPR